MISKGCLVKFVGGNNRVKPIDYDKVYLVTQDPYMKWLADSISVPKLVDIVVENEILTVKIEDVEKVE